MICSSIITLPLRGCYEIPKKVSEEQSILLNKIKTYILSLNFLIMHSSDELT